MKRFKIKLDVFDTEIKFYVGFEQEEIEKLFEDINESDLGMMETDGSDWSILVRDKERLDVAVHEIFHFVMRRSKQIGIEDEETRAWMMDYIFRNYQIKIGKI